MIANKSTIEFILSNHTEIINPPVLLLRSRACESRKKHEFFHRPTDGRIEFLERKEEKKKKEREKTRKFFFEPIRTDSFEELRSSPRSKRPGEEWKAASGTTVYYYRSRVSTVKISDRQRLSVAGVRPLGRHRSRKRGSDWFPGRVS